MAGRNLKRASGLTVTPAGDALLVTGALRGFAIWGLDLDLPVAPSAPPAGAALPGWLLEVLERKRGGNPTRDVLLKVVNDAGDHVVITTRAQVRSLRDGLRVLPFSLVRELYDHNDHRRELAITRLTIEGQEVPYLPSLCSPPRPIPSGLFRSPGLPRSTAPMVLAILGLAVERRSSTRRGSKGVDS